MQNRRYSPEERKWMLALARRSIHAAAVGWPAPEVAELGIPRQLTEVRACFVTLTRQAQLRGCIGNIFPEEPLYRNIIENARGAAFRDTRFAPVTLGEVEELQIEISVLTPPVRLEFATPGELLDQLRPGVDGVVLRVGGRHATFLPQVWEHFNEKEEFLERLSQKAGWEGSAWRYADPVVSVYQVESFEEGEEAG